MNSTCVFEKQIELKVKPQCDTPVKQSGSNECQMKNNKDCLNLIEIKKGCDKQQLEECSNCDEAFAKCKENCEEMTLVNYCCNRTVQIGLLILLQSKI